MEDYPSTNSKSARAVLFTAFFGVGVVNERRDMLSSFLKVSLLVVVVPLCVGVSIVNAGVVPLNWTSPTTQNLQSVHMVSTTDGWAVGTSGTIIRWTGTEWIPEFPTAVFMPLFIITTLLAVIVYRKKRIDTK
jgi:hypothetical protein